MGEVARPEASPQPATTVDTAAEDARMGAATTEQLGPDPRWAMSAPLTASSSVKTPGAITATASQSRSDVLSDPTNLMSLSTQVDTLTANTFASTASFASSSKATTLKSAEGRTSVVGTDSLGRPIGASTPGIAPLEWLRV